VAASVSVAFLSRSSSESVWSTPSAASLAMRPGNTGPGPRGDAVDEV